MGNFYNRYIYHRISIWITLLTFIAGQIHADEMMKVKRRLNEILAHHTGQPLNIIAADTDRDNFMDANKAAEYGLIDSVYDKKRQNSADQLKSE